MNKELYDKKISIIVPIYNAENYIERCITSLLDQSYKNIEVILIDDGSQDNSSFLCTQFVKKDSRVKYYYQINQGVSAARNHGLGKAHGEYTFFIDVDDWLDTNVLENLIKHKTFDSLVSIQRREVNKKYSKLCKPSKLEYSSVEFIDSVLSGINIGVVWGILFDTEKLKGIFFDSNTNYLEDTLFLFTVLLKYYNYIKYIDVDEYYNYYISEFNFTSSKKNVLKKCESFVYSLNKINEITNKEFSTLINEKKVCLLEKEMRLISSIKDYKKIISSIKIQKYNGKNLILRIFSFLYLNENIVLLRIYYYVREICKKILNVFRKVIKGK